MAPAVQPWTSGSNPVGSSTVATVTSSHPGSGTVRYVTDVPQSAQNPRRTAGDDACSASRPVVSWNVPTAYVAHATTGAPALRWHVRQWQYETSIGAAVVRNRTAPQRHPPVAFGGPGTAATYSPSARLTTSPRTNSPPASRLW